MDVLTKKSYGSFDYTCRYATTPYYFHTKDGKWVYGLWSNVAQDVSWVAHKVKQEDTLDSLALNYYNNPTLWWFIAAFNDIQDAFIDLSEHYDIIKIPSVTSISYGDRR